jgi:hypothetical protein
MIIRGAEVTVKGRDDGGTVVLSLVETPEGWTYGVDGISGGPFTLLWHADTPKIASQKLRESYPEDIFQLTVIQGE